MYVILNANIFAYVCVYIEYGRLVWYSTQVPRVLFITLTPYAITIIFPVGNHKESGRPLFKLLLKFRRCNCAWRGKRCYEKSLSWCWRIFNWHLVLHKQHWVGYIFIFYIYKNINFNLSLAAFYGTILNETAAIKTQLRNKYLVMCWHLLWLIAFQRRWEKYNTTNNINNISAEV